MKEYLLPPTGQFYKANLHCHTTVSDGRLTPAEVKELYRSLGYSIVAYTDHQILIPHPELADETFLPLYGYEDDVTEAAAWPQAKTCHLCFIARDPENWIQPCFDPAHVRCGHAPEHLAQARYDTMKPPYERRYTPECINDIIRQGVAGGYFVTYNHPTWSLEEYPQYMAYEGMHAMEIVNGSCEAGGYLDYNPRVYDDMLRGGKRLFAVAADDNHNVHPADSRYSDSGVGFVMIKAERLEYRAVMDALFRGDFYASEGPEIHALWKEDGRVHIECGPADRVILTTGTRDSHIVLAEGTPLTAAEFAIPANCGYFRLTVVDERGRHADTQAYFV